MSKIMAIVDFPQSKLYVLRSPNGERNWYVTDTNRIRFVSSNDLDLNEIDVALDCNLKREKAKGLRKRYLGKTGRFSDIVAVSSFGGIIFDYSIRMRFLSSLFNVTKEVTVPSDDIVLYHDNNRVKGYSASKRKALHGSIVYDKMWATGSMVDVVDLNSKKLMLTYCN